MDTYIRHEYITIHIEQIKKSPRREGNLKIFGTEIKA